MVKKHAKYDYVSKGELQFNAMQNKSVYEVDYPSGTTDKFS